jgi:hypothetical protein
VSVEKQEPKDEKKDQKQSIEFGEYDAEFTRQLQLKTKSRSLLGTTYEKAKKIIKEKNIRGKEEYKLLCDIDSRLPLEPDTEYKGQFRNWIDYLGIPRDRYTLKVCREKIQEYTLQHPDIKNYLELDRYCKMLCDLDPRFPPIGLWVDYYCIDNIKDLSDIIKPVRGIKKLTCSIFSGEKK